MNRASSLSLAAAKRTLPILPVLWQRLGLPGELPRLKAKFCSPLRPDRSPSCVIYTGRDGCQRFADKSQGVDVDAIGFLALATGLDRRESCRKFVELAGGVSVFNGSVLTAVPACLSPHLEASRGKPALPVDLHRGNEAELRQVAALRGLSIAGIKMAGRSGLLLFGRVCGFPCWIVTDTTRTLAQARRTDGRPFPAFGSLPKRKTHTLKGSCQSWPVGIREASNFPSVLLVEGGPDLLAACHFIAETNRELDLAPVAMLGAGNRLPVNALALFRGKRVRIYPDADPSGEEAAARWASQLVGAGAGPVDVFGFRGLSLPSGQTVKDLNDAARMAADAQPEGLLP